MWTATHFFIVVNLVGFCWTMSAKRIKPATPIEDEESKWLPFEFCKDKSCPTILEKQLTNKTSVLCFPTKAKKIEVRSSLRRVNSNQQMKEKIRKFKRGAEIILNKFDELNKEFWAERTTQALRMVSTNRKHQWYFTLYVRKIRQDSIYKHLELKQPTYGDKLSKLTYEETQAAQTCFKLYKNTPMTLQLEVQIRGKRIYSIEGFDTQKGNSFMIETQESCNCQASIE